MCRATWVIVPRSIRRLCGFKRIFVMASVATRFVTKSCNRLLFGIILKMHLPRNSSSTYDDLPYGSCWRPLLDVDVLAAHPDRAAWQHLTQEKPPTAVCDLACSSGRQVLQGALLHPHIEFLGVDGSSAHISEADALKAQLGIKNARFECADLLDWTPEPARYELITCVGTYPWVPDLVRERILKIVSHALADDGIAVLHILSLPACLGLAEAQRRMLDAVGTAIPMPERVRAAKKIRVKPCAPFDVRHFGARRTCHTREARDG